MLKNKKNKNTKHNTQKHILCYKHTQKQPHNTKRKKKNNETQATPLKPY